MRVLTSGKHGWRWPHCSSFSMGSLKTASHCFLNNKKTLKLQATISSFLCCCCRVSQVEAGVTYCYHGNISFWSSVSLRVRCLWINRSLFLWGWQNNCKCMQRGMHRTFEQLRMQTVRKSKKPFDMWWITESVHYFFSGLKTFWLLLTVWLV